MPDDDLKTACHRYNREASQYGLHPRNQSIEVSFFQEDMDLPISATDISSRGKPCKSLCALTTAKKWLPCKKGFDVQFCCDIDVTS